MFELTSSQVKKIEAWQKQVYARGVELQQKTISPSDSFYSVYKESWDMGYPYTGAIGGQFEYVFVPTSIGVTAKVRDLVTDETLNITDYENW